jgi:hypothetical protein
MTKKNKLGPSPVELIVVRCPRALYDHLFGVKDGLYLNRNDIIIECLEIAGEKVIERRLKCL